MSVADKINSIKTHVAEAYVSIDDKGGTVPSNKNIANLKAAIESISGGAGKINVEYSQTAPSDTSKLWIKSTEPENIEFVFDPAQEIQGVKVLDPTLETPACQIGCAAVGTKVYLFGGEMASGNLNTIQDFDTVQKIITTSLVTLPRATRDIGCAAVGTKIYLFGGFGDGLYLKTIQVFDTTTRTIETLEATIAKGSISIGCAAVGTKIYLFGGVGGGGVYLNTIQVFDTETKTIETLETTLPIALENICCAAVGTKIYLLGGHSSSDHSNIKTIQEFDPETKTLTTLSATLATVANEAGYAAAGTNIYLFGGINGYSTPYIDTIQEFVIEFPLLSGNILAQQDNTKNLFDVVKSPTKVTIGVKNVYKGNSSNIAEYVDAYLYNGTNWVNINTGAIGA